MRLKRLAIYGLVGIIAISFCHSVSSYTRAQITNPTSISITPSENALIAILEVKLEGTPYILIQNNMALSITMVSISAEGAKQEHRPKNPYIGPGKQYQIDISDFIHEETEEITMILNAKWQGGKAEIKHTIERNQRNDLGD